MQLVAKESLPIQHIKIIRDSQFRSLPSYAFSQLFCDQCLQCDVGQKFEFITGLFLTFLGNFWFNLNWGKMAQFCGKIVQFWEKIVQVLVKLGKFTF